MSLDGYRFCDYRIVPLDKHHNRKNFDCGNAVLNRYFAEQVSQDVKRRANTCYVIIDNDEHIAGFYTLCSSSMSYGE